MPALRILPSRANGAVCGDKARSRSTPWPARSSGAPWCGVPRNTSSRSSPGQRWPASRATCTADRATSPPMLCPTMVMRSSGTGHAATSRSSSKASWCPLVEVCSPEL
ncbi:hypothetical protein D9M68_679720 [compost metagenome]